MSEAIASKLESIISGHKVNADDADWLRAALSQTAPSPQAPGRRKGPPGITLEPQGHEQPAVPVVPDDVARYRTIRNGLAYIEPHESGEIYVAGETGVYTKSGDEFDAAIDAIAASKQKGGQ